ncbi:alpha/beta fold hydrolase [Ekhidna sp.]|uniref:alpha/beta fold hydrolase n=1 Tax=Ekhidna sp. TaxID=2608089 RepID=UPI003C7D18E6
MEQLILIHGALGAGDQMNALKEKLAEDFRIHILEFEGHGSLSSGNEPFTTSCFIEQLEDLIADIGESVHIFGYSMGGFIALLASSKGNNLIKSITTLGTKMKWSTEIAEKEVRHLNPQKIKEKVPAFAQALEKRHGSEWEDVLQRTADFMRKLGEEAPINQERMSQIDISVQMCLADQDAVVSEDETEEVANWLSNCKLCMIPKSKHPIEQTDLTALSETVRSFIEQVN